MPAPHRCTRYFIVVVALLLLARNGRSEERPITMAPSAASVTETDLPTRPIRTDVQLVLVNVSVLDDYGRSITGLQREHFQVYEDKKPQAIAHFSSEDVPISVGIVFDASGSMSNKLDKARMAIWQFLRNANPQDEFSLIVFNDRPLKVADFTRDPASIQNRLAFNEAKGETALLDAIYLGIHEMSKARNARKALLVFSDGGDNHSRYSARNIREAVKESDVLLYAIGIYEPYSYRKTPEEQAGPSLLSELARMTGGRELTVENLNDLPAAARQVGEEMRNLYILGYSPLEKREDGKWHKIQVKLHPPQGLAGFLPLRIFSKAGYYAPHR